MKILFFEFYYFHEKNLDKKLKKLKLSKINLNLA